MGRPLKLDRTHLVQMVKSPDFYMSVPSLMYLKDAAMESWRIAQHTSSCRKCPGSEWSHMQGVCDALFMRLREMKRENDPALQDVKNWLAKRKGYSVNRCVLYYRRSRSQGTIAKFEF